MQEHLLGVRISDQKAHLQKVLEETNNASAQLSLLLTQIQCATADKLRTESLLAIAQSDLHDARKSKTDIEAAVAHITEEAAKTWEDAETFFTSTVADANKTAATITKEATEKVTAMKKILAELQESVTSQTVEAINTASYIRSLEQHKLDLQSEIKQSRLRAEVERDSAIYRVAENNRTLAKQATQIAEAQKKLDETRAETESIFTHLNQREIKAETERQDNEILRQRLYSLLQEAQKKL